MEKSSRKAQTFSFEQQQQKEKKRWVRRGWVGKEKMEN